MPLPKRHLHTNPSSNSRASLLSAKPAPMTLIRSLLRVRCSHRPQPLGGNCWVTLLKLDKEVTSVLLPLMFVLSFAFYYPVVKATVRLEKKRVLLAGFFLLIFLFLFFAVMGVVPVRALPYAYAVAVFAALPMATLGIIPNAIVADIAEADGIETGDFKAAMFFGIRAFVDNLGMAIGNMLFSFFLTLGKSVENPLGIRVSAVVSLCVCVLATAVFCAYNEGTVLKSLRKKEAPGNGEPGELRQTHGLQVADSGESHKSGQRLLLQPVDAPCKAGCNPFGRRGGDDPV